MQTTGKATRGGVERRAPSVENSYVIIAPRSSQRELRLEGEPSSIEEDMEGWRDRAGRLSRVSKRRT